MRIFFVIYTHNILIFMHYRAITVRNYLASCLVQTAASNIANPFDNIVIRIVQFGFEYFEIAHLKI